MSMRSRDGIGRILDTNNRFRMMTSLRTPDEFSTEGKSSWSAGSRNDEISADRWIRDIHSAKMKLLVVRCPYLFIRIDSEAYPEFKRFVIMVDRNLTELLAIYYHLILSITPNSCKLLLPPQ